MKVYYEGFLRRVTRGDFHCITSTYYIHDHAILALAATSAAWPQAAPERRARGQIPPQSPPRGLPVAALAGTLRLLNSTTVTAFVALSTMTLLAPRHREPARPAAWDLAVHWQAPQLVVLL